MRKPHPGRSPLHAERVTKLRAVFYQEAAAIAAHALAEPAVAVRLAPSPLSTTGAVASAAIHVGLGAIFEHIGADSHLTDAAEAEAFILAIVERPTLLTGGTPPPPTIDEATTTIDNFAAIHVGLQPVLHPITTRGRRADTVETGVPKRHGVGQTGSIGIAQRPNARKEAAAVRLHGAGTCGAHATHAVAVLTTVALDEALLPDGAVREATPATVHVGLIQVAEAIGAGGVLLAHPLHAQPVPGQMQAVVVDGAGSDAVAPNQCGKQQGHLQRVRHVSLLPVRALCCFITIKGYCCQG